MKPLALALAITGLALLLPSCASTGHGGLLAYDAYYDDAYGPIYDGYWGDDDAFYYCDGAGHPFVRDGGSHFRHGPAGGFHGVHVAGGHAGGGRG
ncbi:hypothetical protein [Phenylobacterium sp.]|uniref:hypothetical protein n=1 Tax=Phenylobacterium sp. TaxID=1871053 RepID=UPI00122A2A8B|nr:hypothetical protein [Phenylobacterium sp.]THD56725.1 MAG: hypothetical protein E8A12_14175 [Phenylobacterium sp.]